MLTRNKIALQGLVIKEQTEEQANFRNGPRGTVIK